MALPAEAPKAAHKPAATITGPSISQGIIMAARLPASSQAQPLIAKPYVQVMT